MHATHRPPARCARTSHIYLSISCSSLSSRYTCIRTLASFCFTLSLLYPLWSSSDASWASAWAEQGLNAALVGRAWMLPSPHAPINSQAGRQHGWRWWAWSHPHGLHCLLPGGRPPASCCWPTILASERRYACPCRFYILMSLVVYSFALAVFNIYYLMVSLGRLADKTPIGTTIC